MSDEDVSPEDQTEDPSDKRLQDAHKEGRVAISRDIVLIASLAVGGSALIYGGSRITLALVGAVRQSTALLSEDTPRGLLQAWAPAGGVVLACLALASATAIVATMAQTGGGFWTELLAPQASRLFSLERLTHAFTREGAADIGIAAIKTAVLLGVAWTVMQPFLVEARALLTQESGALVAGAWAPVQALVPRMAVGLAALAVLDTFVVRGRFMKKLMMTKEQLKREHKEDEGDPQIKGRRRRKHREMAQGRVHVEVPIADALIVNPTHIAIAVRYRKKNDKAPRVTAKGKGEKADAMRALAIEHGVPIVRDVPLARFLHKKVKVGREVPAETYRAIAAVLAYVYKVTGRPPGSGDD